MRNSKMPGALLFKTKSAVTLNWWPSLQDYNEAVQIPIASLQDLELKLGLPYTDVLGLPRPVTGSFASVYRMSCSQKEYALRLFLRNLEDQADRYRLLSDFLQQNNLPYTVVFDFLSHGIKVRGERMPALKMEWLQGVPLDNYIIENLSNEVALAQLTANFCEMMKEMRGAGIAHGDLQHGNILICGKDIRLVDYDGMYVPAMQNYQASELGHCNYQHPERTEKHFGPYLDNFSAWVIYASLRALQIDSRLLHQLGGGDDCLLFRQSDFRNPLNSAAFAAFERHEHPELNVLGRFLRAQLDKSLPEIPYLQLPVPDLDDVKLAAISEEVTGIRSGPRLVRGNLSEWLSEENSARILGHEPPKHAATEDGANGGTSTKRADGQSWIIATDNSQAAAWIKPHLANAGNNPTIELHEAQQAALAQAANSVTLPPELALSASQQPRTVKFYAPSGKRSPDALQALMLVNPAVWATVIYVIMACTWDADLVSKGVYYQGLVTRTESISPDKKKVSLVYLVDGNPYSHVEEVEQSSRTGDLTEGSRYQVLALPAHPNYSGPLFGAPIKNQTDDAFWALLWACFSVLCEACIWVNANKHYRLARHGMPFRATVIKKRGYFRNPSLDPRCSVTLTYQTITHKVTKTIPVSAQEFKMLRVGAREVILCDASANQNLVIYKFCAYHPVLQPPPVTPSKNSP